MKTISKSFHKWPLKKKYVSNKLLVTTLNHFLQKEIEIILHTNKFLTKK